MFDQALHDALGHCAGDGKPDTHVPAAPRENGCIDPDQFAFEVHQCAAGIPRVDRCICLDKVFIVHDADIGTADRTDNAHSDGLAQSEWIADR